MADAPKKKYPCPKCNRTLVQSGELTVGNVVVPTFQCDECIRTVDFLGEKTDIALTFALDPTGKPFDPASEDGKLHF